MSIEEKNNFFVAVFFFLLVKRRRLQGILFYAGGLSATQSGVLAPNERKSQASFPRSVSISEGY